MNETDTTPNHITNPYISIDFDASSTASINSVDSYGRKVEDQHLKHSIPVSGPSSHGESSYDSHRQRKNHVLKNFQSDFLDSIEADPTYMSNFLNSDLTEEQRSEKFGYSNKIPGWVWKIIVYVLGVTYSPNDKQSILSRVIQIVTTVIGLTFCVTGMVHQVYDIKSNMTNTSVMMGITNIFIGFIWICLGLYSQKLAARLFSNRNFVECVRLHSRTFLKVSVAGIFIFFTIGIMGINTYVSYMNFGPQHCDKLKLNRYVCHVLFSSHVAFTFISLTWNVLVGCTLLAVCRTHTIVVRRFITTLDKDAKALERINQENSKKFRRSLSTMSMNFITHNGGVGSEWFIWDDNTSIHGYDMLENQPVKPTQPSTNIQEGPGFTESQQSAGEVDFDSYRENKSLILTNEEILGSYWKISKRMRVTSRYLQRWLGSWIFFICLWITDYVITWLSHSVEIFALLECIVPLFLLLLLASAFAEVNGEGQRMIRCICPTTERLKLLQFLTIQPLQMQVFNFSLNYNAIVGVVFAFSIAFATRLILDEMT